MDSKFTHLTIRLPKHEMDFLRQYCQQSDRNQTDVVREFIRSLEPKIAVTSTPKAGN